MHFAKTTLSSSQQQQFMEGLKQNEKTKGASASMLDAVARQTMCDIVVLQPNRQETDFISINLYVDDKGVAKQLPVNQRATSIAMECGMNIQILGDCFIGKQFDNDSGFHRFDFTLADLNTSLSWFKRAKQMNLKRTQTNEKQMKERLHLMEKQKVLRKVRELKLEGNTFFKKNQLGEAIKAYEQCCTEASVSADVAGKEISKADPFYELIPPILSNLSLCCLILGKVEKANIYALRCTEFRPKWFKGWARLASAKAKQGELSSASKFAHQALLLKPGNTARNTQNNRSRRVVSERLTDLTMLSFFCFFY